MPKLVVGVGLLGYISGVYVSCAIQFGVLMALDDLNVVH